MKFLLFLSDCIVPLVIFMIVFYGISKNVCVYDEFIKGSEKGMHTVVKIMPTVVGLMLATGVLRSSGVLSVLSKGIGPFTDRIGLPADLVPLAIVKMFSSSAATGLLLDIFKEYGTDSRTGLAASLMMSSTETIFYTMSVYFMSVKVTKTRYTLTGAVLATIAGIAASVYLSGIM